MQKTKIVIVLAAMAALTLALVGLAAAQVVQNQTYTNTAPITQVSDNGFWGWVSSCFGYGSTQEYQGQPSAGVNATVPAPYQGGYGYSSYGYGYGYGPCWAWR